MIILFVYFLQEPFINTTIEQFKTIDNFTIIDRQIHTEELKHQLYQVTKDIKIQNYDWKKIITNIIHTLDPNKYRTVSKRLFYYLWYKTINNTIKTFNNCEDIRKLNLVARRMDCLLNSLPQPVPSSES